MAHLAFFLCEFTAGNGLFRVQQWCLKNCFPNVSTINKQKKRGYKDYFPIWWKNKKPLHSQLNLRTVLAGQRGTREIRPATADGSFLDRRQPNYPRVNWSKNTLLSYLENCIPERAKSCRNAQGGPKNKQDVIVIFWRALRWNENGKIPTRPVYRKRSIVIKFKCKRDVARAVFGGGKMSQI
jgi:hypothetical protein